MSKPKYFYIQANTYRNGYGQFIRLDERQLDWLRKTGYVQIIPRLPMPEIITDAGPEESSAACPYLTFSLEREGREERVRHTGGPADMLDYVLLELRYLTVAHIRDLEAYGEIQS